MKPQAACFCLVSILYGGSPAYPDTYHRNTEKNGVICFSNTFVNDTTKNRGLSENPKTGSLELQRAREQAEIEYWRSVEAKARSLRNTPDTEVHRRARHSLQGETFSLPNAPSGKNLRAREMAKMGGGSLQERKPVRDPSDSKRVRSRRIKIQAWKNASEPESQRIKRRFSQREALVLK